MQGLARSTRDKHIPWLLEKDTSMVVVVTVAERNTKAPSCFSLVACDWCASRGVTELSVTDHDVVPMVEAGQWHVMSCEVV